MHVHPDGAGDHVVSLDAFKITRHRGSTPTPWSVRSLVPWARDLLDRPEMAGLVQANSGYPLVGLDSGKLDPQRPFRFGVGFKLRGDAITFLTDVEGAAERWSR